jgi:hypothetical protein
VHAHHRLSLAQPASKEISPSRTPSHRHLPPPTASAPHTIPSPPQATSVPYPLCALKLLPRKPSSSSKSPQGNSQGSRSCAFSYFARKWPPMPDSTHRPSGKQPPPRVSPPPHAPLWPLNQRRRPPYWPSVVLPRRLSHAAVEYRLW